MTPDNPTNYQQVFIVESLDALTHTFIREDVDRVAKTNGPIKIIDISDKRYLSLTSVAEFSDLLLALARIFASQPINFCALLICRRRVTNLKAIYLSARILPLLLKSPARKLSAHFLGKASVVSVLLARLLGTKLRVICHASDLYDLPRLMHFVLRRADEIETVTYFGKGFVLGRLGRHGVGKVFLRRNLVAERSLPELKPIWTTDVLHLSTVARLAPQKDLCFAISVISEIKTLGVKVQLKIAGSGPLEQMLRKQCESLGLTDDVLFLGALKNAEALDLIANSDAFLLPCSEADLSDADGLPVAFQEALKLGRPVFCRTAFGVAELAINGINGWAFPKDATAANWASTIVQNLPKMDSHEIAKIATHQFP